MKAIFRTDASVRIGTGHVMRCLTLASLLRREGAEILFVCRSHDGNLNDYIRGKHGFPVHALEGSGSHEWVQSGRPDHEDWLETGWKEDALETRMALETRRFRADWMVIDHYALDERWENALRPMAGRLFVIDDLADRVHACDIILDQNLHPGMETRYGGRVPADCRKLLGPRYALLREEFRAARAALRQRDGHVRRILIFFGGTDPGNETGKALEAWAAAGETGVAVDVVVGATNAHRDAVKARCERLPDVRFHAQTGDMAALMAAADLALGAGGTATWERCSLGLPTLCISIAENQRSIARTAAEAGLVDYLGHCDEVDARGLAGRLAESLRRPDALARMSEACLRTVDGLGASRIAAAILGREADP